MHKTKTSVPCIILDARAIDFLPYGVGRYARELSTRLPALRPDWCWLVLRHSSAPAADLAACPGVIVDAMPRDDYSVEQARWRELCAKHRPDLIHSLWYHTAEGADCLRVLTVQDAILLKCYRDFQTKHFLVRKPYYYRSIEAADGVIVPSLNTFRELTALMRFPSDAIRHVPLAASPEFAPVSAAVRRAVRAKYKLPLRYFFASAHYRHAYKNFDLILAAHDILARSYCDAPPLVVAGKVPPTAHRSSLQYLGFVPDRDLAAVLSESLALIYPSFDEGFGLPVLEAMASGAPVICSRAASIPEVAGEAAVYFDPSNPRELADAMRMMMDYPVLRANMIALGVAHVRQFTWEATVAATLRFYEDLLARPHSVRHPTCRVEWPCATPPDELPPASATPRVPGCFIDHALDLLKNGDVPAACEFLDLELRAFGESPDAWRERGKLHKRCGEWRAAATCFKRMLEIAESLQASEHLRSATFHLGECLLNLKQKSGAVMQLQRCLEIHPDHAAAKKMLQLLSSGRVDRN